MMTLSLDTATKFASRIWRWYENRKKAKMTKINALVLALKPLYSRLALVNEMCVELMDGDDLMLRKKIFGLVDGANYNEVILKCLSAIDNLSLDDLKCLPETIKSLTPLRAWLVDVASGFNFPLSISDVSKMHDEIKNFDKIVDGVVEMLAKELCGFWARKRDKSVLYNKSVLYKKMEVVDAT